MIPAARRRSIVRTAPVLVLWLGAMLSGDAAAEAVSGTPVAEQQLRARLIALAADARLGGAAVGVSVIEARTGRALVEHNARRAVSVASNAKLITTAAALAVLGPDYRFRTEVYASARKGPLVTGGLYIKGYGDPSLREEDLWRLASDLRDVGIRRVRGGLWIDESYFDAARLAPLYDTRSTDAYYRPASAPLCLHENIVSVGVWPGVGAGQRARVATIPHSGYFRIDNRVTTVQGKRRAYIKVQARPLRTQTAVRLTGRAKLGHREQWFRKRVDFPGQLVGVTFAELLRRGRVGGVSRRVRRATVPQHAVLIATHRSRPLAELIRRMDKMSSNLMAEQLVRVLGAERYGAPGTWPKGLNAIGEFLASIGIARGMYRLENGSGLYEASSFAPSQLAKVLRYALLDFRYGPEYVSALAISGVDGTLAHRFTGSGAERYVRAKTGTLADVVALSGYAGGPWAHDPLIFVILITELPSGRIRAARTVADEMASTMVAYLKHSPVASKNVDDHDHGASPEAKIGHK